jgi:D-xylonolactonase
LDYIIDEIPEERDGRFNDVATDPAGRVFCGTMPIGDRLGKLYLLDLDGTMTPVVDGVNISNGIGFTPDERKMYYTESMARSIYLYDYDRGTGAITNRSVFLQTPDDGSIPDGMTVDAEGHVWSARWDGSSLYRYTPDGVEERRVMFPAKKVSSVVFGGDDLTDMYVTTAGGNDKVGEGHGAGALFRMNLGIRGKPEYLSRIGL